MRIIGGNHKGRKFYPPKSLPVRPTTDFAKEGLFNMLRSRMDIANLNILDLCCGTGNISFEFASRDANSVMAVDQNFSSVKFVNTVANELNLKSVRAIKSDIFKFIKKVNGNYDLIFADPPYEMEGVKDLPQLIFDAGILITGGLLIIEHSKFLNFEEEERFVQSRKFGNVNFTFFE